MSFSDDDLKRLKKMLDPKGLEAIVGWRVDEWRALLARMESAEKVIEAHCRLEQEKISYDNFVALLNQWRKVAGKP